MFESPYARTTNKNIFGKDRKINRILKKYIELKKINDVLNRKKVSKLQRKFMKKHNNRKNLLKKLHKKFGKPVKGPQETFEVWHSSDDDIKSDNEEDFTQKKSKNFKFEKKFDDYLLNQINKITNSHTAKEVQQNGNNDNDDQQNENETENENENANENENENNDSDSGTDNHDYEDDTDSETDVSTRHEIKRFTESLDNSQSWTKSRFHILTRGLEMLPQHHNNYSITRQHAQNLNTLLHLNILKKNWRIAYNVFTLLIRLPRVNIKNIWPLGIEILIRQREEDKNNSNSDNKEEKFFDWLISFNSSSLYSYNVKYSNNSLIAPAWRSGSKTHAPLFVISFLWDLLVKKQFAQVMDKLDELLLVPPFSFDGAFHYIKAVCLLAQNIRLHNKIKLRNSGVLDEEEEKEDGRYGIDSFMIDTKEFIISKINENKTQIKSCLTTCDDLKFKYPKTIYEQMNLVGADSKRTDQSVESDDDSDEEQFYTPQMPLDLNEFEDEESDTNVDTKHIFTDDIDRDIMKKQTIHESDVDENNNVLDDFDASSSQKADENQNDDFDFDFDFE